MINAQLEVARRIVPQFDRVGFLRGNPHQLPNGAWAWNRPDGALVLETLSDSESSCILAALRNAEKVRCRD